jgi:hypothetical protein
MLMRHRKKEVERMEKRSIVIFNFQKGLTSSCYSDFPLKSFFQNVKIVYIDVLRTF